MNSKFTFCMQLLSCRWRSKAGGNLAEEKKLLSLAWREVGGGLGSLPKAGGDMEEKGGGFGGEGGRRAGGRVAWSR